MKIVPDYKNLKIEDIPDDCIYKGFTKIVSIQAGVGSIGIIPEMELWLADLVKRYGELTFYFAPITLEEKEMLDEEIDVNGNYYRQT